LKHEQKDDTYALQSEFNLCS